MTDICGLCAKFQTVGYDSVCISATVSLADPNITISHCEDHGISWPSVAKFPTGVQIELRTPCRTTSYSRIMVFFTDQVQKNIQPGMRYFLILNLAARLQMVKQYKKLYYVIDLSTAIKFSVDDSTFLNALSNRTICARSTPIP